MNPTTEVIEARLRAGVPVVHAAACRAWSEARCAGELDELIDAGSHVLLRAATQAASDAEFLDRLENDLRPALRRVVAQAAPPSDVDEARHGSR